MAGPDAASPPSMYQPAPHVAQFDDTADLSGIKIGVFWDWFNDAHEDVRAACQQQVDYLVSRGATVSIGVIGASLLRGDAG